MLRLFVAIDLPQNIKENLKMLIQELAKSAKEARWVAPENLHITFKFIGNFPEENLAKLIESLTTATKKIRKFELKLGKLGAFPTSKKARIFWIGTEKSELEIERLHKLIDSALEKFGIEKEGRKFHSHVTLARFKNPQNVENLITESTNTMLIKDTFKVNEVSLFKSVLTPKGSIYAILKNFPLED